ncbi:NAD(P)/FAD-dependent oxidoreductase [Streptomyces sp. GC420]|uniref:NAD(P)/FAD-dependent oxidoreductase n=1 Tax=Streptomyces sp. GC420 TaxID=2697568 RepID=UPI0014151AD0|nr:FAD-dependent oxidoreductase [Streptomyces sp. GC420]NBM21164.1 FAD-dependent oxidoreductase [Streptomyces sp. GC420]
MSAHIAVVGASLAGLRTAEQLRAAGHSGPVTVLGDEPHAPYNRPPLSKELLADPGDSDPGRLHAAVAFRRRASARDVDFRLGSAVVSADLRRGLLTLSDGAEVSFDGLVAATGLRPRRLTLPGPRAGRYALRTLDDCIALRGVLRPGARVVVIGAGFIGCETAATALGLGCRVTVVEPAGPPMGRVLGDVLARAVQRHHEAAGITFRTGRSVAAVLGRGEVSGVDLDDGTTLGADVVVEAVGSLPNTEWLSGNPGLDLSDGVLCDNTLLAVGTDRLAAAGDVARFPNPLFDTTPRRVEHWSVPGDTARRAAATLTALLAGRAPGPEPFAPVPAFWSDQLGLRLQSFGSPALADDVHVAEGDPADPRAGLLATYHRRSRLVGTVAINLSPARMRELREAFTAPAPAA